MNSMSEAEPCAADADVDPHPSAGSGNPCIMWCRNPDRAKLAICVQREVLPFLLLIPACSMPSSEMEGKRKE